MLLEGRSEPIEATTTSRTWIVLLPIEEIRQDARLTGEIVWHGPSRKPYRRRALQSLRAFSGRGGAKLAETGGGTGYGPLIVDLDRDHRGVKGM